MKGTARSTGHDKEGGIYNEPGSRGVISKVGSTSGFGEGLLGHADSKTVEDSSHSSGCSKEKGSRKGLGEKESIYNPKEGHSSSPRGLSSSLVHKGAGSSGTSRVGTPSRTPTPKLERHFSFECEEEGFSASVPFKTALPTSGRKDKPVKPARKNLPKVGNPLVPAEDGGINSIFALQGDKTPLEPIRRRASPTLRMCGDDLAALPVSRGRFGNACSIDDSIRVPNEMDVAHDGSVGHCNPFIPGGQGLSASLSVLGECWNVGVPDVVSVGVAEISRNGFDPGSCKGGRGYGAVSGTRDVDGEVTRNLVCDKSTDDAGLSANGASQVRTETVSKSGESGNTEAYSSPVRLISQDSGVDFRESLETSNGRRTMHLEGINNQSSLYSQYQRLLEEHEDIQCCPIPKEKFYSEFGDVSEDIGLDRLAGLYGPVGTSAGDPGTVGYRRNEELTSGSVHPGYTSAYVLNNGGNFNLLGEFGDVSDDLGAGRFPSCSDDGSEASGHSFGDYVTAEADNVIRRARIPSAGEVGVVFNPVLEFPGFSSDSGMDTEEVDPYEYDEDYANELGGPNLDEQLILEVLCANRVNQMTRTYNDIEAVSRLLEEKEKDLELTARIGKELLDQNQGLKVRLAQLEVEIRSAHDGNTQLKHELQQKTQLLHALTSDEDGSPHDLTSPLMSPSSGIPPPIPSSSGALGPLGVGGRGSARAGVELLKRRITWLESENKSLRMEASQLARDTQRVEEEEAKLVEGVTQQLASVSEESRLLSEELERVRNEGGRQKEEVDTLLIRLDQSQHEIRRLRQENEELSSLVVITRENQDRLTTELADFKERYGEVMCLLTEAQENLRKMRQKELPSALSGNRYLIPPITTHHGFMNHFGDSIASELESSLNSELSMDSGIHMPDAQAKVPHYRKVFETVRSASRSSGSPSPSPLHRMPSASSLHGSRSSFAQLSTTATLSSSSMQTCRMTARPAVSSFTPSNAGLRNSFASDTPRHLYGGLPTSGFYSLDSAGQSEESDHSGVVTDNEECLYPMRGGIRDGIPGSPGAKELQAALVRISKQQEQQQQQPPLVKGEKSIGGYEGKSREPSLDSGPHRWSMSSVSSISSATQHQLPYGCRTPDSIMSTGSSRGSSRSNWKMPEKLQIVKPLEGSLTLGWWSRLATPSLSAALEERPGVKVRGGVSDSIQQHTLMDLEEDDSLSIASTKFISRDSDPIHPGKFFQHNERGSAENVYGPRHCAEFDEDTFWYLLNGTSSVYTYTNSTVLHPDNTVPPSPMPQSPAPATPSQPTPLLSRRSSVSTATPTFSTALGLAKMLRERGISASSSENDLAGQAHFTSATATPCNSPDETPLSSRSPSPEPQDIEEDSNPFASLLSSGAELLRRSLGGGIPLVPQRAIERSTRRSTRHPLSRSDRKALVGMKLVEKLERIGLESIISNTPSVRPFPGLVPLTTTLQVGTMYARPAVKSPMAQLTSLKSMLRSRSREGNEEEMCPSPTKRRAKRCPRLDLGTVPLSKKPQTDPLSVSAGPSGPRGTISAIFFGRKGGLM